MAIDAAYSGLCPGRPVYLHADRRVLVPIGCRAMDKPSFEKQITGRRVQYRERIFYAGDGVDEKRLFHQSANALSI